MPYWAYFPTQNVPPSSLFQTTPKTEWETSVWLAGPWVVNTRLISTGEWPCQKNSIQFFSQEQLFQMQMERLHWWARTKEVTKWSAKIHTKSIWFDNLNFFHSFRWFRWWLGSSQNPGSHRAWQWPIEWNRASNPGKPDQHNQQQVAITLEGARDEIRAG